MRDILSFFLSHFAIFVEYPPISVLYTNTSSPQVFTHSSSPKLRSNHLTKMTIPLSPHLKCPGYELFSSFFPNSGVCAFIHSDAQSFHLPQFDLLSPGFQLIWPKISRPNTSKFICTLYRSHNSTNHDLLFDHLTLSWVVGTLPWGPLRLN